MWKARVADMDDFRSGAKCGEIAARINEAMPLVLFAKDLDCAIHGEPLGDTPQINSGRRIMKVNAISGEQLDSIAARRFDRVVFTIPAFAWQQPELLQRRRDGDVEYAGRWCCSSSAAFRTL